jgi:serine/threonine protein kinase
MSDPLSEDDPREVGQYQLVARLGAGATGVVYEATSRSGERVAVKVLHPFLVNSPGSRERLKREGKALRQVSGVRAVRVLEVDSEGPKPFLAMELVEGQTLSDYVNTFGAVRGAMMWALAEGLAEALSDIHDAGIVHRDLKPSNVLLGPDGVRVVDFGISILADATSLTGTGSFVGTAAWLSPEQVQGDSVTEASDVFSLGLLLAYASSGYHPFGDGRSDAVMYRIMHNSPKLDDVSSSFRGIVESCLEKEADNRLSLAEVRRMISAADRSASPDGKKTDFSGTRVVGSEEQIEALVNLDGDSAVGSDETEIVYDLGSWPQSLREKLEVRLQSSTVEHHYDGSELVISKQDEDLVDELIRLSQDLPPPSAYQNLSTSTGFENSGRKFFFGIVASIMLIGAVIWATSGDSGSPGSGDTASPTTVRRAVTTTVSGSQTRLQQVKRGVASLSTLMIASLEQIKKGVDYSGILEDGENALLMTDVLQLDCRGQWLINDSLFIAGFSSIVYDEYFSNSFGDKQETDNFLVTRVAVTVLHSPNSRGSFVDSLSYIIGGDSLSCNDSDFRFAGSTFGDCAMTRLGYGLVEADENCLRSALRSVDWETDTNARKVLKITRGDDRFVAKGDTLMFVGNGASRDGSARSSLSALVWTDPRLEFAVVIRATVTNYSSNVSQSRIDEHAADVVTVSIAEVFDAVKEVFRAP